MEEADQTVHCAGPTLEVKAEAACDDTSRNVDENSESCKQCHVYMSEMEALYAQVAQAEELLSFLSSVSEVTTSKEEKEGDLHHAEVKGQATNSPVAKAMSNSAVLQKIFGNFKESFLLTLRLVCKKWEKEASTCLLNSNNKSPDQFSIDGYKYGTTTVRLSYNPTDNVMGRTGLGSVKKLAKLITKGKEAGRTFPCSRFVITCPNLLTCAQLTQFLVHHGHLIQGLKLKFIPISAKAETKTTSNGEVQVLPPPPPPPAPPTYEMTMQSLRNLFFKWAVNIQYLYLEKIPWPADHKVSLLDGAFPPEIATIPNLRILVPEQICSGSSTRRDGVTKLKQNKTLVRGILLCAPNLQKFHGDLLTYKEELKLSSKTGTIKTTGVSIGCLENGDQHRDLEKLKFVSAHCTQLETIFIGHDFVYSSRRQYADYPDGWTPQVELLNKILENNQDSLNEISGPQLAHLPGLRLPKSFPKLKNIVIWFDFHNPAERIPGLTGDNYFRMFPNTLDLEKTFPNLSSLHVHLYGDGPTIDGERNSKCPLPNFETCTPLTSVTNLFLMVNGKADNVIRQMSILIPNVKHFNLSYLDTGLSRPLDAPPPLHLEDEPLLQHILQGVWTHFTMVETLRLGVYTTAIRRDQDVLYLDKVSTLVDSYITGLSVETVRKLKENPGKNAPAPGLCEKRDQPSILNMKNLKLLTITSLSAKPMLSFISHTHGFNLMKDLRVNLLAQQGQSRDEVLDDPLNLMADRVQIIYQKR